jgi:hypothetical protein
LVLSVLFFWLCQAGLPLFAEGPGVPAAQPAAANEDFGQYLADHESDLEPFFSNNAEDFFKLGLPLLMGMAGWVIAITMAVGWVIDVLMSRGYAFLFAPAHADIKRSIVYATGSLFLGFVYNCLILLAVVFSLKLTNAGAIMTGVVVLLLLVAFAAQVVWILYLYRTSFPLSTAFYIAIVLVHAVVGFLITKPFLGSRASSVATDFVDRAIAPRLEAEAAATKRAADAAVSSLNETKAKSTELQTEITQAGTEQEQLRKAIEDKKNSDIYVFSRIIQTRAQGDLPSARDQLMAFLTKFPSSHLNPLVQTQLAEISDAMAVEDEQHKQQEADAARAAAQARADLLARADKGEVTLSEMRQALIGKTRSDVNGLLGLPSDTASDSWGYRKQMIINPLTNTRYGLTVYFDEGKVQSVDYNRNGGL